jgi:hypothetical protein
MTLAYAVRSRSAARPEPLRRRPSGGPAPVRARSPLAYELDRVLAARRATAEPARCGLT